MNQELFQKLAASGAIASDWAMPFMAVPRQEFLPATLWDLDDDGNYYSVTRADNPVRWQELAMSEEPLVTQVDDGHPDDAGVGYHVTSSSSKPYMVAVMLKHLEIGGGERVLEIGTGTGWNAALLAQRLGQDRVTSIEIDPGIADTARVALSAAGYGKVRVVTGNGSEGYQPEAPYGRILSTAACHTVPYAWVEQTKAGGRIVTPWGSEFYNWGLLSLDVHADGTATGGIVDTAAFMRLRDQRIPFYGVNPTDEEEAAATVRETSLKPTDILKNGGGVLLAMSSQVPRCQARYLTPAQDLEGESVLFLADRVSRSWARLTAKPDSEGPNRVIQGGPRPLFDEVETVYDWWLRQSCPGADDWRFIVDKDGQRIELM